MSASRAGLSSLLLALSLAVPVAAQAPQFRANVTQTGDEPFDGTMYFGTGRLRIEGISNGEQVTAIIDSQANRMIVLMPDDEAYMTMDLGAAPFAAPGAYSMDPANPCSTGEVTACRALGQENVNGRAARGWEYMRDGERETAWVATDLRFPVRIVEADGTTTNFTDVQPGPQPANLFEPPSGWTPMDVGAMLGGFGGGFGGRGAAAGRGQVPPAAAGRGAPTGRGAPAGRGAAQPGAAGAVDPAAAAQLRAQLQAMGLPPDQIEMALGQLGAVAAQQGMDYSAWEAGDGWILDLVVTGTRTTPLEVEGSTGSETLTVNFTGSVPITYGTPGAGGQGPAWQLVPGIGSPLGESQRIVFSGTSDYRYELVTPMRCPDNDGVRVVTVGHATGGTDTADATAKQLLGQARWEIAPDLATHTIMAGVKAAEDTDTRETTITITGRCPMSDSADSTRRTTTSDGMSFLVNLPELPLPATPQVMNGTTNMTVEVNLGGPEEIPATVRWTLRPIQ